MKGRADEEAIAQDVKSPESRVKAPAKALIALSGASLVLTYLTVFGLSAIRDREQPVNLRVAAAAPLTNVCISLPAAVLMLLGGVAMHTLNRRWLALLGGIATLLPCNVACIFGIPIGWWVLTVLKEPEVKAAFERRKVAPAQGE